MSESLNMRFWRLFSLWASGFIHSDDYRKRVHELGRAASRVWTPSAPRDREAVEHALRCLYWRDRDGACVLLSSPGAAGAKATDGLGPSAEHR